MPISDLIFFQFEADFVESLRCIPMQVRFKLDTCGVKLKLEHWHRFSTRDRERLVTHPCRTHSEIADYRELVRSQVLQYTDIPPKYLPIDPTPPWLQTSQIPMDVQIQAAKFDTAIAFENWVALSSLQRFALCKLSQPGHENRNFLPALREFGLK
ncbi:MAG: nitrate reductase associated protein [Cyanobacteria bacterium P01_C01_bin.70]